MNVTQLNFETPASFDTYLKLGLRETSLHFRILLDDTTTKRQPSFQCTSSRRVVKIGVQSGQFSCISRVLGVSTVPLCGYDGENKCRDPEVDECGPWPGQEILQLIRDVAVVGGWPVHRSSPDCHCEWQIDPEDELTKQSFRSWNNACGHVVVGFGDVSVLVLKIE